MCKLSDDAIKAINKANRKVVIGTTIIKKYMDEENISQVSIEEISKIFGFRLDLEHTKDK